MLQYVVGAAFLYFFSWCYSNKESNLPDVIIGPGGVLGFYTLGICHYLVNHFDLHDKHLAGFSSGAFNVLFMRIHPEKRTFFLRGIFNCQVQSNIELLKRVTEFIQNNTVIEDYTLNKTSIAVSHTEGLVLYDTFFCIKESMRCCNSSSFVPFVTNDTVINFYNHKLSLDSYFLYGKFMQNYDTPPLVITPDMFGRFNNPWLCNILFIFGIHHLQNTTIYQIYLNGYHDATLNHAYFEQYLKPIKVHSSSSS